MRTKEKQNKSSKELYWRRKENNQCVDCGVILNDLNKTRCLKCINEQRDLDHKKANNNICVYCNKDTTNSPNKRLCLECREKRNKELRLRVRKNKEFVINMIGKKCKRCGLETDNLEVYDFHHTDPNQKDFLMANLFDYSLERIMTKLRSEIDKCILLCANCHRIIHFEGRNGNI